MLTSCTPSIGVAAGTELLYARSIPHGPRRFLRQSNSKLARFDRPNPRCGVPREFQRSRRNAVSTRIAPATFRAYALRVVLRRSSQGDTYDASDIQKELVRLAAGAMTHDRPLTTASAAPRYRHRTNASQTNECCSAAQYAANVRLRSRKPIDQKFVATHVAQPFRRSASAVPRLARHRIPIFRWRRFTPGGRWPATSALRKDLLRSNLIRPHGLSNF